MSKFRKKPVVIEAFQWTGTLKLSEVPAWFDDAIEKEIAIIEFDFPHEPQLKIKTLESGGGYHYASLCDWIIQGIKGELYPCKPDIFEQTYERVED